MLLHEIIEKNIEPQTSILIEEIFKYKKSLLTYYANEFPRDEPILMVTSVSNAAQYGKIVPSSEFNESLCEYLGVDYISEPDEEGYDEDLFSDYETISFNSIPLKNL
jgi:hypothetical protein